MNAIPVLLFGLWATIAADAAHAQGGTMIFNGTVVAQTCQVSANGSGGGDATVRLPTVASRSLSSVGMRAAQTRFDITVGTPSQPCSANAVRAQWVGAAANVDPGTGRLNNTGGAANAQGVQLVLLNSLQQDIDLRTSANSSWVLFPATGVATIDYFGEYYGNGPVVEGLITTAAEYQLEYN